MTFSILLFRINDSHAGPVVPFSWDSRFCLSGSRMLQTSQPGRLVQFALKFLSSFSLPNKNGFARQPSQG